jgi:hypothetical protein
MSQNQKVILRFTNGKMLKGYIQDLKISDEYLYILDESDQQHKVRLKELKAIFFVKKFEGERSHPARKHAADSSPALKRIIVRFKDGESIVGSVENGIPWKTGHSSTTEKAFTIIPDDTTNNTKILVVATAVKDVSDLGS